MANVEVRQDNQPTITADTPDGAYSAGHAARRSVELDKQGRRQFLVHIVSGTILSLAWLFVAVSYAVSQIGVFDFFKLPLHQAAILLLAIVGPIILVWLVLLFIRRDRELRTNRLSLEARLDLLTYPDTAAGARVREVTTALQRQTEELSRASLAAVERVRDADELLRQRSNQLWHASDGARNKAENLAREIGESTQALEASVEGVSLKGDNLSALLRSHSDSLDNAVNEGVERMQEVVTAFEDKLGDINGITDKASDLAGERAEELKSEIMAQINALILTVDHAAGKIENTSISVGATIREEMEKAANTTDKSAERLYETINGMQEQAASLTEGFGADVDKIIEEIDRVTNKAGDVETQLSGHLDAYNRTIENADEKTQRISTTLSESGTSLDQTIDGIVAKADNANDELSSKLNELLSAAESVSTRSQEMSQFATAAEQQLSEVGSNFQEHTETLKETVATTAEQLTSAGQVAAQNAETLKDAIAGAEENASSFGDRAADLAAKLQDVVGLFDSKSGSMSERAEGLLNHLEARGEAIGSQIDRIATASDLAKAEANALEDVFAHHIALLEDAAEKAATTGNSIGENLSLRTESLEKVIGQIGNVDQNLSAGMEQLRSDAAEIAELTGGRNQQLVELISTLATGRDEAFAAGNIAAAAYDKVNDAMKSNADNLVATAQETSLVVDQIDALSTALQGHVFGLNENLGAQIDKLSQAEQNFADGLSSVGETVARESDRLEAAQDKITGASEGLSGQVNQLQEAGNLISTNLSQVTDGLGGHFEGVEERAEAVKQSIDAMMQNLETRAMELDQAALHSSEVARLVTQAFHTQAQDLMAASEQASQRTTEVFEQHAGARRKTFMRDLSFITESLNSKSVDITKAIEQNVPEDAWKKYLEGDRSVFTRGLLKRDDNFSLIAIKNQFQEEEHFREHVNRYLRLFEEAVQQAEENDPEDVLSSTMLSSDVGKLYLLLSRALGRIR